MRMNYGMKVPQVVKPGATERLPCNSRGLGSYSHCLESALNLSLFSSGNRKGNSAFVRKFSGALMHAYFL